MARLRCGERQIGVGAQAYVQTGVLGFEVGHQRRPLAAVAVKKIGVYFNLLALEFDHAVALVRDVDDLGREALLGVDELTFLVEQGRTRKEIFSY